MGKLLLLFFIAVSYSLMAFAQSGPTAKMEKTATAINGRVGVYALVLETGEHLSYHGDQWFAMQSVYKFPIAMAVLDQVDKGRLTLDQLVHVDSSEYIPENGHSPIRDKYPGGTSLSVRQLLRYSVAESDGTASDVQLRLLGGTKQAENYVRQLGIRDMNIATTEMVQVAYDTIQYRNRTTPKAMCRLFEIFYSHNVLSSHSKTFLTSLMTPSSPWFNRRIKGLLPAGTPVIHKTGTSGTIDGLTRTTNDAGIITLPNGKHVALSVFIADSHASQEQREMTIAKISKLVFDYYTGND